MSKFEPPVLDRVWMICMPEDRGVVYGAAGMSARGAWQAFEELELGGTGCSATDFRRLGYRARRVVITLEGGRG